MKLTKVLLQQHIGKHFEKHWRVQGQRKVYETGALKVLRDKGIPVTRAEDFLQNEKPLKQFDIKQMNLGETPANWHDRICHTYKDDNVLLEGLTQAKFITKTIEPEAGLSSKFHLKKLGRDVNEKVRKIILTSHLFDAEQQKLPKIKDPERPAWNFPRIYGITERRRNKLITSKLLQLIELIGQHEIVKERSIFNDLIFSFPFEKSGNLIQFQLSGDTFVVGTKPLRPVTDIETHNHELLSILPVKETITLNLENIYELINLYPIKRNLPKSSPHTIFIHYNATEVKNIYEEEVTDEQIFGRSLLKTFTVAASYARNLYGPEVQILKEPVTVQCVQSDGQFFHFGIFQLNTLDLEGVDGVKNVWYQTPKLFLFDKCCYEKGKPVLEGYNSEVMKHLVALYHNI